MSNCRDINIDMTSYSDEEREELYEILKDLGYAVTRSSSTFVRLTILHSKGEMLYKDWNYHNNYTTETLESLKK